MEIDEKNKLMKEKLNVGTDDIEMISRKIL